ncbi:MAG TPA: hypothetical protein VMV50_02475 [Candidatus Paceibacterota bacterium]|nr:hypothetical protein [Candidatus Paceibacterota bacterium]
MFDSVRRFLNFLAYQLDDSPTWIIAVSLSVGGIVGLSWLASLEGATLSAVATTAVMLLVYLAFARILLPAWNGYASRRAKDFFKNVGMRWATAAEMPGQLPVGALTRRELLDGPRRAADNIFIALNELYHYRLAIERDRDLDEGDRETLIGVADKLFADARFRYGNLPAPRGIAHVLEHEPQLELPLAWLPRAVTP